MMIACFMMALASALGIHQIVTRFILESPAEWTEVLIRFSLIWMVFLGIPTAFRTGSMVSVDLLYRLSGQRMKRVLDAVVAISALVLCCIILWWGWDYTNRGSVQSMLYHHGHQGRGRSSDLSSGSERAHSSAVLGCRGCVQQQGCDDYQCGFVHACVL